VAAAASKDIPELWRRAVELREAAKLGEEGELDRELDGWVAKRSDLPPRTVLFVTATRLLGSAPEVLRLADALTPLVDDVDADVAAAAARLLADPAFKAIAPTKRDQLANKMLARAEDAALSPDERLDFAKAAYRTGGGRERIKANKVLRSFLDSQDPELKAEGALAMAELDAVALDGELRILMERIARVPDARGRLAASYLQREDLRRQKDRLRADTLERAQDSTLPPEMTEFLEVMRLIQERHLEARTSSRSGSSTPRSTGCSSTWTPTRTCSRRSSSRSSTASSRPSTAASAPTSTRTPTTASSPSSARSTPARRTAAA
jgi:hypothetical protein